MVDGRLTASFAGIPRLNFSLGQQHMEELLWEDSTQFVARPQKGTQSRRSECTSLGTCKAVVLCDSLMDCLRCQEQSILGIAVEYQAGSSEGFGLPHEDGLRLRITAKNCLNTCWKTLWIMRRS